MRWTADASQFDFKHTQKIIPIYVQIGCKLPETRCSFLGVKHLKYEVDHSPASGVKAENKCSHTSIPTYKFMARIGTNLPLPIVN
jgi:hypothetical protein